MLNMDKQIETQLQTLLDNSGDSIKAVWTDGEVGFSFYVLGDYDRKEVKEAFSELLRLFPDLDNANLYGGATDNKEYLESQEIGYYVHRL